MGRVGCGRGPRRSFAAAPRPRSRSRARRGPPSAPRAADWRNSLGSPKATNMRIPARDGRPGGRTDGLISRTERGPDEFVHDTASVELEAAPWIIRIGLDSALCRFSGTVCLGPGAAMAAPARPPGPLVFLTQQIGVRRLLCAGRASLRRSICPGPRSARDKPPATSAGATSEARIRARMRPIGAISVSFVA